MYYTIAIFPEFKGIDKIDSIRRKYDPSFHWLKPHIALVYYFKERPSKKKIDEIIRSFHSFEVKLNKIHTSSKSNFIFLDVTKGKENIIELKNALYHGLHLRWNKDFVYNPHMTLANFKTKDEQRSAIKEIKKEDLNFSFIINSFLVLEVSEDLDMIKSKRRFELS